jgi:hypothetical protein
MDAASANPVNFIWGGCYVTPILSVFTGIEQGIFENPMFVFQRQSLNASFTMMGMA